MAVGVEDVKLCLEGLKHERTELTTQMNKIKQKLEEWPSPGKVGEYRNIISDKIWGVC